jgi:hypothetical protein
MCVVRVNDPSKFGLKPRNSFVGACAQIKTHQHIIVCALLIRASFVSDRMENVGWYRSKTTTTYSIVSIERE